MLLSECLLGISFLLASCSAANLQQEQQEVLSGSQKTVLTATTTATLPPEASQTAPVVSATSTETGKESLAQLEPEVTSTAMPMRELCSPLAEHPLTVLPTIVSDPYNPPPGAQDGRHMGVDFSYYQWQDRDTIAGVPVQAVLAGVVSGAFSNNNIPYGYGVIIETPLTAVDPEWLTGVETTGFDSLYVLYAHLEGVPEVQMGVRIGCGQVIGSVGQTGGEGTPYLIPHLHVEMRLGPAGEQFEEIGYYDTRVSERAREIYVRWRLSGEFRHFDPMLVFENANSGEKSLYP